MTTPKETSLLILGAGWLSQHFLLKLLSTLSIPHIATTTNGRIVSSEPTLRFTFDPSSSDTRAYESLPRAKTVLITFPIKGAAALSVLVDSYESTHPHNVTHYILLGSTGIYAGKGVFDHQSEATNRSPRWEAEEELLRRYAGCVLNLAGLWGEPERDGRIWDLVVPDSKEGVGAKASVHWVHGRDVSWAVVGVHRKFVGERWLVSDGGVYDWWDVLWREARRLEGRGKRDDVVQGQQPKDGEGEGGLKYRKWVLELMQHEGVRCLPRTGDELGRRLDARAFWKWIGTTPMEERFGMQNVRERQDGDEKGKF